MLLKVIISLLLIVTILTSAWTTLGFFVKMGKGQVIETRSELEQIQMVGNPISDEQVQQQVGRWEHRSQLASTDAIISGTSLLCSSSALILLLVQARQKAQ